MNLQITPEIEITRETETELEPLYRVIIHNDDVTPMDFVVHALTSFFYLGTDRAAEIMLKAHITGAAYVQTLPKSEAERRVNEAHFAAGLEGYPLHFSIEPE
jgi:ATP-dependent Clp protease adaptor protein ClpS